MARLRRPHIPTSVKIEVALKGLGELWPALVLSEWKRKRQQLLDMLLVKLSEMHGCAPNELELHHRPALVNRQRYTRNGKIFYKPPANSVSHLAYLPKQDHAIETRVRGLNGQHSDLALARKRKRSERKKTRPRHKIRSRGFAKRAKPPRDQLPMPPRRTT